MIAVRVSGVRESQAYLQKLADGAKAVGGMVVVVGSPLKYAFGIETGRHRSGRLARRAGGARMLTRGLQSVHSRIKPTVVAALPHGRAAARAAVLRLGYDVQRFAQAHTPVVGGGLRRSLHTRQVR